MNADTPTPSSRKRPQDRRSRTLPLLIALALVVLLGVALLLSSGEEEDVGEQTAQVQVDGETLPEFTDAQSDPAVGLPAPALRGTGFDGAPVDVEPGEAPLVVIFAAHWCPHCQREVTELSPWLQEGGAKELGVDVVTVSTAVDPGAPNYPPSTWFEREGWSPPVLLDDDGDTAAAAYGLSGYPFFTFIDADGTVVGRMAGSLGLDTFEAVLEELGR